MLLGWERLGEVAILELIALYKAPCRLRKPADRMNEADAVA